MTSSINHKVKSFWRLHFTSENIANFWAEFLSNSGHFLILKSLADITIHGWVKYLTDPADYILTVAMLLQTAYLCRRNKSFFFGNLLGVLIYTAVDLPLDQSHFFYEPSHLVFWLFSLQIATVKSLNQRYGSKFEMWLMPLESIIRTLMVFAFCLVVKLGKSPNNNDFLSLIQNLNHADIFIFLFSSLVLVGLLLGFKQLQIVIQQRQLKHTSALLRDLAQWGMGNYVVDTFVNNPEALNFHRQERAILFMDIRKFTTWSEVNEPDMVAGLLNRYYQCLEPIAESFKPLRVTLNADEVMAIYPTPSQAVAAAQAMQVQAATVLEDYGLQAGCAVHYGEVIEGLFGSKDVRTYTVIGDVVNTAKRLESGTLGGEITVSDVVYQKLGGQLPIKTAHTHYLKGKAHPFKCWTLATSTNVINSIDSN